MKISVITVSCNSAATIEDTIKSVAGQTCRDVEYIVVDGGSTDGTAEIIKRYEGGISRWVSEKDGGIYDAMNKGIRMATGDVVGILNSDDVYAGSNVLALVAEAFKKGGGCCYSDLTYVSRDLRKVVRYWRSGEYFPRKFRNGWHPPHPSFFVRREMYDRYGVFNPDFKIAADYEIMLRFMERHRMAAAYLPEVTVNMRVGGESGKSLINIIRANAEVRRAWLENGLKPPPLIYLRKPLSKLRQLALIGRREK